MMGEIDRRCRSEIPVPKGFEALSFRTGYPRGHYLAYECHSDIDYKTIKPFFVEYFEPHGWRPINYNRLGDAYDAIPYRKEDYFVAVYRMNPKEPVNYVILCEKISENTPEEIRG